MKNMWKPAHTNLVENGERTSQPFAGVVLWRELQLAASASAEVTLLHPRIAQQLSNTQKDRKMPTHPHEFGQESQRRIVISPHDHPVAPPSPTASAQSDSKLSYAVNLSTQGSLFWRFKSEGKQAQK